MTTRFRLWAAFLLVHAGLAVLSVVGTGNPMVDVTDVYRPWAEDLVAGGPIAGIDTDWVYPILAHIPIVLALVGGAANYAWTWLLLVTVVDAVAFALLVGAGRSARRVGAAWWWLAFLAALGPIALDRLDAVTAAMSVSAVLLLAHRPRLASALLAIATWIKVWPAAILATAVIALRTRVRLVVTALIVSGVVAAAVVALGGGAHLLGFLTLQTGRGLQVEAPVSLIYLWQAALGVEGARVYFDERIITFQVDGAGIDTVVAVMTPLLALVGGGLVLLGAIAVRAGASTVRVLPTLMLALVLTLIAVNKVGSPQYVTWLVAPVVLGLVWRGSRFALPAAGVLALAFLTHVIYPYLYALLRDAAIPMVAVITVRNLGFFVLLAWCVVELVRARREAVATRRSTGRALAVPN